MRNLSGTLPRHGSRREPFGKFRRYVQDGAVNKCGRAPLTVPRIQREQVQKHVERSTSSRLSRFKRDQIRFHSDQTARISQKKSTYAPPRELAPRRAS